MDELKRVIPVVLAHFVLGLVGCVIYALIRAPLVDLIDPFIVAYRLRAAALLFITYVPALLMSGILIGYALAFGKSDSGAVERWSSPLLAWLRGAFLLCLVCIIIDVILAEGIAPVLEAKQSEASARTDDYHDYITLARQSMDEGDFQSADYQSTVALQIWGTSKEAGELHERIRYMRVSSGATVPSVAEEVPSDDAPLLTGAAGLTVLDALDHADVAMKDEDFYSAHYYAMLAYRLARDTDPNKQTALRVAAAAWNQIGDGLETLESKDDRALYSAKRSGYDAIQSGDYLTAYYIFLELYGRDHASGSESFDPDVERFLEISRKGVLDSFFFLDETGNVRRFEAARDVFFVIKQADGSSDAIFVKGLTWSRAAGRDMTYLRDFECAHFNRDSTLAYQFSVPYAKMFPHTDADGTIRPEILLHAVDRNRPGVETIPTVSFGTVPESARNILLLDMPYRDFNLIVSANRGPGTMPLFALFKFENSAKRYGFSESAIRCEIINRLADPFLILIMSIYALILGWRFRLARNAFFKAWWILAIPLFPVVSLFAIETIRYLFRLAVLAIVRSVPQNPILLILGLLAFCFAFVSILFFSQRSD